MNFEVDFIENLIDQLNDLCKYYEKYENIKNKIYKQRKDKITNDIKMNTVHLNNMLIELFWSKSKFYKELKCFKCREKVELLADEETMDRFIIYCPVCDYSLYPNYQLDKQDIINWWNDNQGN